MRKSLILTSIIVISFFLILFLWYMLYTGKSRVKVFSNVTDLFSLFTPLMRREVNFHLSLIECEPEKYYFLSNKTFCFICKKEDVCFEFGWVRRPKFKMNPKGVPFLRRSKDKEREMIFYSRGFSNLLDCKCNGECSCSYGIEVEFIRNNFTTLEFSFPRAMNVTQKLIEICSAHNLSITFEAMYFTCGNFVGYINGSRVVV